MDVLSLQKIQEVIRTGDGLKALEMCEKLLEANPNDIEVLNFSSSVALQFQNPEKSSSYSQKAIAINPDNAISHYNAGLALFGLKNFVTAIDHFKKALTIQPGFIQARIQLANTLVTIKAFAEAEKHYLMAVSLEAENNQLYNNLANTLSLQGKIDEAIKYYKKSLQCDPNYYQANFNLANVLLQKKSYEEALYYYYQTLIHFPQHLEANYYYALTLIKMGNPEKAVTYLEKILPNIKTAKLFMLLGNIYLKQNHFANAINTFEKGLEVFKNDLELLGAMLMSLKKSCTWNHIDYWQEKLLLVLKSILKNNLGFNLLNFQWLGLDLTGEEQLLLAKKLAHHHFSSLISLRQHLAFSFSRKEKSKLKIGYVSGDIRDHATSHLIKNMFAYHDRQRFEIFLYSTGPNDHSDYRHHITTQCDHFIDLLDMSISESAQRIYNDGIDILIDMMGYTEFSQSGIFAVKPAPIQISYLAYPGTTGLDTMDYVVADQNLLLVSWGQYSTEKIIFLPGSLYATDQYQEIADTNFTRENCGLPQDKFIFCSFNNAYKIDLQVFTLWMRILTTIPDSILWLYNENKLVEENLKNAAKKQKIDPDRLCFASKLPKNQHLARLKLADLCLDCLTINAGTTAIDALWAGVPFIGYENPGFRPRVARSILSALGLPNLVTKSTVEYEQLAIFYATHPEELLSLREEIKKNKTIYPLFQTKKYVRSLENAYEKVWQNYLSQQLENVFID